MVVVVVGEAEEVEGAEGEAEMEGGKLGGWMIYGGRNVRAVDRPGVKDSGGRACSEFARGV